MQRIVWVFLLLFTTAASAAAQTPEMTAHAGAAGVNAYASESWAVARATVINKSDQARQPLLLITGDPGKRMQFGQSVWLPAHSMRIVEQPLRMPKVKPDAKSVELRTTLLATDTGSEVRISESEGLMLVARGPFMSSILATPGGGDNARNLLQVIQESNSQKPSIRSVTDMHAPSMIEGWASIHAVAVTHENPDLDAAQIDTLRKWLVSGGKLWIMLDETSADWPSKLLGDDWNIAQLDRVQLTQVQIDVRGQSVTVESDAPFTLVRTVPTGMQVLQTAQGYPAAMTKRIGQGELLVTTLSPRAFVEAHKQEKSAIRELARFWRLSDAPSSENQTQVLGDIVREQVGYDIMSRNFVLVALGAFLAILLASGFYLSKRDRLELASGIACLAAIAIAVILVTIGITRQSQKPLTVASAQLIQPAAHQPYANVVSLVGLFKPQGKGIGELTITADHAGVGMLDESGAGANVRRMLWTDRQQWQMPDAPLRSGSVQTLPMHRVAAVDQPIQAEASLDETAIAGSIDAGPLTNWRDGIIATPTGQLVVRFDGNNFTANTDQLLAAGQFIDSTTFDKDQQRHQDAYRRLLADGSFVTEPTLLAWADGMETGLSLTPDQSVSRTESLVMMPVQFRRPEPGRTFTVPAALLDMVSFSDSKVGYRANIFIPDTKTWISPISNDRAFLMEFTLPEALSGMQISSATLDLNLRAPNRPVDALLYRNGKVDTVTGTQSPMGKIAITLDGKDAPVVIDGRKIVVGISVGRPATGATDQAWSLRHMSLNVTGTIPSSNP